MKFTIDDKHFTKWMWVKTYVEKCWLKMILTEGEVLIGGRHRLKYQYDIFNFVDLCKRVSIVW